MNLVINLAQFELEFFLVFMCINLFLMNAFLVTNDDYIIYFPINKVYFRNFIFVLGAMYVILIISKVLSY